HLENLGTSRIDGVAHEVRDELAVRRAIILCVSLDELAPLPKHLLNDLYGDRARDVPSGMPADTVTDDVEPELLIDKKRVLVRGAFQPQVCLTVSSGFHGISSALSSPL